MTNLIRLASLASLALAIGFVALALALVGLSFASNDPAAIGIFLMGFVTLIPSLIFGRIFTGLDTVYFLRKLDGK